MKINKSFCMAGKEKTLQKYLLHNSPYTPQIMLGVLMQRKWTIVNISELGYQYSCIILGCISVPNLGKTYWEMMNLFQDKQIIFPILPINLYILELVILHIT